MNQPTSLATIFEHERLIITPALAAHGITLFTEQRHTLGERFLMQALTTIGGHKFILEGETVDGQRVIIKATNDEAGKREIEHERTCRSLINTLDFAYDVFATPAEHSHFTVDAYLYNVQYYIEQDRAFLDRPLVEQYTLALSAFKAQEHSHATTSRHLSTIKRTFGHHDSRDYCRLLETFVLSQPPDSHPRTLIKTVLDQHRQVQRTIDQYGNFLTHTDFVPHNFRINGTKLYLLDFSAIRFGNKHESWARFINFMVLHHPALATALLTYVAVNRAPEEAESLWLMRLFRLTELITYYTQTVTKSTGHLRTLNEARVVFWSDVLAALLERSNISDARRDEYTLIRDRLRSDDEKKRQIGLH